MLSHLPMSLLYLLILLAPKTTYALTGNSSTTAASKFKAPNSKTPPSLAHEWAEEDARLWVYVNTHVPSVLDHTGSSAFDDHLKGVQAVLRYWGAPSHLTRAGLFHSIYGTEGFQGFSLPLTERAVVRNLIGQEAEKLCFVFCMADRYTVDRTVLDWQSSSPRDRFVFRARPELGRFPMALNRTEWLDFIELTLADWLEQVEGAASKPSSLFLWEKGEAYAYRRLAYRRMSEVLLHERSSQREHYPSSIPKQMFMEVMATEPMETRHLVQQRTPPMSDAAHNALLALRASGEDIPLDLSPQPMEKTECDQFAPQIKYFDL